MTCGECKPTKCCRRSWPPSHVTHLPLQLPGYTVLAGIHEIQGNIFPVNFPLLQPHKLDSGKYFLKISKPQQVQSLNYYSKKRGKLTDSFIGLFSRDPFFRGTQRQFLENICSEDDLRSRIFGTFVVKFLACLPLLGFSNN